MATRSRLSPLVAVIACTFCTFCTSPPQQQAASSALSPKSCAVMGRSIDSAFAVDQARSALAASSPGLTFSPSSVERIKEGLLFRMVVSQPPSTRGGGGLVFVNAETGCATVLIRYE
jgi:hypothetical protein